MAIRMAGTSIAQLARYMQPTSVVHLDMPEITGVHVHELQDYRHAPSACRLLHRVSPMSSLTAFATLYAQPHDCFDLLELTSARADMSSERTRSGEVE